MAARLAGTAVVAAVMLATCGALQAQQGGGSATPQEAVDKVNQAARQLADEGEAAFDAFRGDGSPYVWKDSYVVVASCAQDETLVHPIQPQLEGRSIKALTDENGEPFGEELCQQADQPDGGWVEYMWPKPGEQAPSRKVSYVKAVQGTPYVVIAGVYEQDASLQELEQISGRQP